MRDHCTKAFGGQQNESFETKDYSLLTVGVIINYYTIMYTNITVYKTFFLVSM